LGAIKVLPEDFASHQDPLACFEREARASPRPTPSADAKRFGRNVRVAAHYDELSPYYNDLWGEHIHHGYYLTGVESRQQAAENLIELVIGDLRLGPGDRVLDVGCGVGGTSRYVAAECRCEVIGLTLSAVQARMATDATPVAPRPIVGRSVGDPRRAPGGARPAPPPRFIVADAAALPLTGPFDALIALEVLSHVEDRGAFFGEARRLLKDGGGVGIAAWLKADDLSPTDKALIASIEEAMLVTLPPRSEYERLLSRTGFELVTYRDISTAVAKTWDLCLEIVANPALWSLALAKGRDTMAFVKSFRAMQKGFASGVFRYAVLIAERRPDL
jgi:tocopherol O-methyltransferase